MSKLYPECPLSNHLNCKYYGLIHLCAIVRTDKLCKKQRNNGQDRAHHKKEEPIEATTDTNKIYLGSGGKRAGLS